MYLEIDEDMPSHPKSTRLCAALQNGVAWAYMIKLWSWARKYQKDGDLSAYDPAEIEFAVGWSIADGKFYAAAVKVGFIDETTDGAGNVTSRRLHNWMKRTGGAIRRMEAESAAKREWRLHAKGKCGGAAECRHCSAPVDGEEKNSSASTGRPPDGDVDIPPTSQPDKTSQGKPSQDPDLPPSSQPPDPDRARARVGDGSLEIRLPDGEVDSWKLATLFGRVRAEAIPTAMPWIAPTKSSDKAEPIVTAANREPEVRDDILPTMRLLFAKAKLGDYERSGGSILKDASFAWGTWCSSFTALREELHGLTHEAPAPPRRFDGPSLPRLD